MTREKGGPLSVLARCILSGERLRVHVRGINKVRGFAVGTLVSKRSVLSFDFYKEVVHK